MIEVSFSKRYTNLDIEVSLRLERGFNFILGPSGCGKTTTVRVIAGLLKPDEGFVKCCEEVFLDTDKGIFLPPQRRRVGVVFQDHTLMPHLTVKDNINFALGKVRNKSLDAGELISRFGLSGLEDKHPHQLSGGQRQRVAVVMALAFNPRALLMDEPFSSLDFERKIEIIEFLKDLELDIPVVVVSHDLIEALLLADKVFFMESGRVVKSGGRELLSDALNKIYKITNDLGVPLSSSRGNR